MIFVTIELRREHGELIFKCTGDARQNLSTYFGPAVVDEESDVRIGGFSFAPSIGPASARKEEIE